MQVFFWIILLMVIGISIFAIQNSSAAPVTIKFFFWQYTTSLIYTILGSIALGILLPLLIWIPTSIRAVFRGKKSKQEVLPPE
jgi:uncharacterized integral membrane protein